MRMTTKPKMLYVYRNPYLKEDNFCVQVVDYNSKIISALSEFAVVEPCINLLSSTLDYKLARDRYNIMITYLPYELNADYYQPGIDKLKGTIQEFPDMQVVVLTGAHPFDVPDQLLESIGVKAVIRKEDAIKDSKNLQKAIKDILRK